MTPKQLRFVQEYLIDLNATQAAIRAGYSPNNADVTGPRLLGNVGVSAAIQAEQAKLSERTEVTQEWVIERLQENLGRALTAVEVLDRDGRRTGEYTYNGAVANRALELLGKHLGMFKEVVEHKGDALSALYNAIADRSRPGPDDSDRPTIQ